VHPRPVGVEDARHLDLQLVLAVVVEPFSEPTTNVPFLPTAKIARKEAKEDRWSKQPSYSTARPFLDSRNRIQTGVSEFGHAGFAVIFATVAVCLSAAALSPTHHRVQLREHDPF
jgi:hypothetical protein